MGQLQTFCIVDRDTGEVVEDYVMFLGRNPKYLDRGYIKVFTAFLPDLIESDKVAGKSIRLLFYMLQTLNYNSLEVVVFPQEAMKDLNISEKTYYRWINDLIGVGLIEKINPYKFKLKPFTFVRGSHEKVTRLELEKLGKQSSQKEV